MGSAGIYPQAPSRGPVALAEALPRLAQCDIVIEAVFEDMEVKQQVFRKLDSVLKPGAILATNTSTLDVDRIAGFTKRPQDVVGTHFFSPANVMKLLEVVRGAKTASDVLATTMALARTRQYSCVIALGCVIRGETPHFDFVAGEAASGLQLAALETGIPVSFGVLTCETREQALARAGGAKGNKGAEAARSALEMADVFSLLRGRAAE